MRRLLILLTLAALASPAFAAFTRVNNASNYCGDSTAACTLTVPSTGANHLLAVAMVYNDATSNITISSASGLGGTWVHPAGCHAFNGVAGLDWIYSLTSSAGGTSVTVNLSGAGAFVGIFYFEYSGTAPFSYETCGVSNPGGSTLTPGAGSITTTGANDMALAILKADAVIAAGSAVSPAPWTTPVWIGGDNVVLDDALNFGPRTTQALFTAPTATFAIGSTLAFKDATTAALGRKRVRTTWLVGPSSGTVTPDWMPQIAADMGLNEAHPHGVPESYDFYVSSFLGQANSPPVEDHALEAWGVIYVNGDTGSTATNTLVQLRNLRLYWKQASTGQWTTVSVGIPEAGFYAEDFSSDLGTAPVTQLGDGSVTMPVVLGSVTHYFAPFPRIPIAPGDIGGVVVVCEARLALANQGGADDRANAHFVLSSGADYYPEVDGAGIERNPAVAGGKMKIVTNAWRSFAMTTLTLDQLRVNPPPIDLSGIAP